MSRFVAGDTVVLNGHRVTVAANSERPTWADLYDGLTLVAQVEADFLPDPEPREEPEWKPGDLVRSAGGLVYLRTTVADRPWRFVENGAEAPDSLLPRPLVRLVAEGSEVSAAEARIREAGRAEVEWLREHKQNQEDVVRIVGYEDGLRTALDALSSGPAIPAPNPDDRRDEWDTFGTKRGVVVAEPDTPPLTPGMSVAHRDGLHIYKFEHTGEYGYPDLKVTTASHTTYFDVAGTERRYLVSSAHLRPVSLVEKPERRAVRETVRLAHTESDSVAALANRIYDTLFGGGPL